MEELKPCPFCGGHNIEPEELGDYFTVSCQDCGGSIGFAIGVKRSREEAIEAWNTRYERTCKNLSSGVLFVCSECGGQVTQWNTAPRYCPNCGAKVVE